jgi:DNA-directed RNA polymerase specialized sigma24 family protein
MEAVAATATPADGQVAARTRVGENQAVLALYDDHLDGVYDFLLRVVRDRAVAADVARQIFAQARELDGDHRGVALYALARRCALEVLRQRRGVRRARQSDREGFDFTQINADQLSDPSAVLFDRELIELVWDAAAALSPDDYSLLDLHLRRGVTLDDLADYADLNDSAGVKLARLRVAFADVVSSTLVARRWRKNCIRLDLALSDLPDASEAKMRMVVRQHVRECGDCQESTRRFVTPEEVLSGFAPIPMPMPLRRELRKQLEQPSPRSKRHRRFTFGIL